MKLTPLGLCLAVLVASGCVYVTTAERTTSLGAAPLTDAALLAVREGETTRSEIEAAFGPPAAVEGSEDGPAVLVYGYQTRRLRTKRVLFAYSSVSDITLLRHVKFEVVEGVVVRVWQEESGGKP